MPDSQKCLDARASLDEIRSLRSELESAYAGAATFGNPEGAERAAGLKRDIEARVAALRESVFAVEAERIFDLRRQYDAQASMLRRAGLVEVSKETDGSGVEREMVFMRGIDGKRYPLPSYETVAQRMFERRDLLAAKADQGFTKLILVPFGMPLSELFQSFRNYMLAYKKSSDEAHTPDRFPVNEVNPVAWNVCFKQADVLGKLLYDQVSFGLGPDSGGKTKHEILDRQNEEGDMAAGWRVLLLQTGDGGKGIRGIKRLYAGTRMGTEKPRRDIDSGLTAAEYLAYQQSASVREDSPYFGESGMCPEEWIILFLAHLEETGKPLDDFQSGTNEKALLTGAYFTDSDRVTTADWYQPGGHAYLGVHNPDDLVGTLSYGPRYAVRV